MWYDPERLPHLLLISLVILPIKACAVNKRPLLLQPHFHKRDVSNLLGVYRDTIASEIVAPDFPQPVTLTKLQHLDNKQSVCLAIAPDACGNAFVCYSPISTRRENIGILVDEVTLSINFVCPIY